MALNQQLKSKAIKRFELRLKTLCSKTDLTKEKNPLHYLLHIWIQDIITILAILNDDPKKAKLIANLPKQEKIIIENLKKQYKMNF